MSLASSVGAVRSAMLCAFKMRCHTLRVVLMPPTWQLAKMTLAGILKMSEERIRLLSDGDEIVDDTQEIPEGAQLTCEVSVKYLSAEYSKLMRAARAYVDAHPAPGQDPKPPKAKKPRTTQQQFGKGASHIYIPAQSSSDSGSGSDSSSSISNMSAKYRNCGADADDMCIDTNAAKDVIENASPSDHAKDVIENASLSDHANAETDVIENASLEDHAKDVIENASLEDHANAETDVIESTSLEDHAKAADRST